MDLDEKRLARQATEGDEQAFTAIFDRYYSAVLSYIRYRCDGPAAEDLAEMVFERLISALPGYAPERGPFSSWIYGIARHIVADWLRRERLHAWLPWEAFLRKPAADPLPEEVAQRRETHGELLAALAHLTVRERDVLGLKFSARLTNRQIANLTGLGENQVAVILYRAVRRLRRRMQSDIQDALRSTVEVEND